MVFNKDRFTKRLRMEMDKLGINSAQLAAQLGISKSTVHNWLAQKNGVSPYELEKLSQFLNVDSAWLVGATPYDSSAYDDAEVLLYSVQNCSTSSIFHEEPNANSSSDVPPAGRTVTYTNLSDKECQVIDTFLQAPLKKKEGLYVLMDLE